MEGRHGETYSRVLVAEGRVVGAQFLGPVDEAGILLAAIRQKMDLGVLREALKRRPPAPWFHRLERYIA